jgi:FkbM family methyltransferase
VRTIARLRNLVRHLGRLADDERIRSAATAYGRLDYPNAEIHLQLTSPEEFYRLKSCSKEPWTVRWIEQYLQPGEVLYDVGANVGAYTLVAAVAVPGARVVAFEPGAANFAALCANLELNEVGERVMPVPLALGDSARPAPLQGAGIAGASPSLNGVAGREHGTTVLVDRLDDVVDRFGFPPPDHLKLDVDGGELQVLAGAERLLQGDGIRSAMVELDRVRGAEVTERLTALGLELAERFSGSDRPADAPSYGLFMRA